MTETPHRLQPCWWQMCKPCLQTKSARIMINFTVGQNGWPWYDISCSTPFYLQRLTKPKFGLMDSLSNRINTISMDMITRVLHQGSSARQIQPNLSFGQVELTTWLSNFKYQYSRKFLDQPREWLFGQPARKVRVDPWLLMHVLTFRLWW